MFEEIEQDIIDKERFVLEQTDKLKEMNDSYLTMLDYAKVLERVAIIIPRIHAGGDNVRASMHGGLAVNDNSKFRTSLNDEEDRQLVNAPLMGGMDESSVFITHIAGTIESEEKERLKKLLFRATRGKALTYFSDFTIKNPAGELHTKSVYIVVFQEGRMIRDRIVRICDSFMGQRFDLPPIHMIKQKIEEV